MRTMEEIIADFAPRWNATGFGGPGSKNDRSALLDEMIERGAAVVAPELVNNLEDGAERNLYSFVLVTKLLLKGGPFAILKAQGAMTRLPFMDQRTRFAASFKIFAASREDEDRLRLHMVADHLPAPDNAWAYLMIYGLTMDSDDLFLAGQAMKAPAAEPGFSRHKK